MVKSCSPALKCLYATQQTQFYYRNRNYFTCNQPLTAFFSPCLCHCQKHVGLIPSLATASFIRAHFPHWKSTLDSPTTAQKSIKLLAGGTKATWRLSHSGFWWDFGFVHSAQLVLLPREVFMLSPMVAVCVSICKQQIDQMRSSRPYFHVSLVSLYC